MAETEEQVAAAPRRRLPKWLTLGTAGFTLSVTLALINAYYAARGSEIILQPAEQVILYRDGEGERAVLTLAMRLAMINAADSAHGDVLMKASVRAGGRRASFGYSSEIKPVFSSTEAKPEDCPFGSRCVALPGLVAIEQGDQILDIPGGAVRSHYLAFPLIDWNCEGRDCASFTDFTSAARTLAGRPLDATVEVSFFSDGNRRMRCLAKPIDLAYLTKNGWMSMRCGMATVKGGGWL